MVYTEDPIAWPTMVKLTACLCSTVADRGLPTLCVCAPVPGPMAILESCGSCGKTDGKACGGQGWVRFDSEYPSRTFPQPDNTSGNCATPMAFTLEVGITRCLPVGKANGISGYTPPSLEATMEATRLQLADKAAMLAAIRCCLDDDDSDLTYQLGSYRTIQAAGDCGGGIWTVTVWGI